MPKDEKLQERRLREFGATVRSYRQRAELSQEQFADLAGLHRTYVGSVERGERNVSLANIYAISDALSIEISELFDAH